MFLDDPLNSPKKPIQISQHDNIKTSPLPKYPTLDDILSDKAPHPFSYASFVGYLSQIHCLETLEFINDVAKYTEKYTSRTCSKKDLFRDWHKIIDTYIRFDSPKELNLSCEIRKHIASLACSKLGSKTSSCDSACIAKRADNDPPSPDNFQAVVDIVKETMKENAYLPFIASVKYDLLDSLQTYRYYTPTGSLPDKTGHAMTVTASKNCIPSESSSTWQQPSSWNVIERTCSDNGLLSKSSSLDSLVPGSEIESFNRGLVTPPESPHTFGLACNAEYAPRSRSLSSTGCNNVPMGHNIINSTESSISTFPASSSSFPHYIEQPVARIIQQSHWRKMSKRLKWGRRNSDKDSKLIAPTSGSATEAREINS